MKKCIKCGEDKGPSEFSKKTSSKDGLQSSCKKCKKVQTDEYRSKYREKVNADAARWRDRNKEKVKAWKDSWRARNAERERKTKSEYRNANRERLRAAAAKWSSENREHHRSLTAANYAANKARKLAQNAAWRAANPDAVRVHHATRRARKSGSSGEHSAADIKRLFELQSSKCACCRTGISDGYHVDHVHPLALGGSNDKTNLQLLCPTCNLRKASRHPVEFMQKHGFLI